jgi:hypothetical protein
VDLATLVDRCDGLAGFDLEPAETVALLNEADRELCTRSEWTRANLSLGPTVSGQEAYAIPTAVARILKVKVDGRRYGSTGEETADRIKTGELWGGLAYWVSVDADGVQHLSLTPAPDSDLSIVATCVVLPSLMVDDADTPSSPEQFHQYLLDYVASVAYRREEDNLEMADYAQGHFDRAVSQLQRYRMNFVGSGPIQAKVLGVHV